MIIEIYTKNFSLSDTVEINDSPIPRVGETITLCDDLKFSKADEVFLVHDVTYELKNNALTPVIKCHNALGAINRRIVLEENGWL